MHAAVIHAFDQPPVFEECAEPVAGAGELVVDVVATALYPLVRSRASGQHYSSAGTLPLIPGVDAVVREASGKLRYAILDHSSLGTMAERVTIDLSRSVPLPTDSDPVMVAAAMNPAMSSWVALRQRIEFAAGSRVLVLGASGNAGRIAVQVAKRFGAGEVVAAGRSADALTRLPTLGADRLLGLDQLAHAADVDVVLDYLWGEPAARGMREMLEARTDRKHQLTWVQIGSVAGSDAPIPSAALRSARLQIVGSGIGSIPASGFLAELPEIAAAASRGEFAIRPRTVPLSEVASAWDAPVASDERIVFVP